MKIEIDSNSLLSNYLPADYCDSFSKTMQNAKEISPEMFMDMAFNQHPSWIVYLLKLRNVLVKPFGLETDKRFSGMVSDKNKNEIIFGMKDKHLTFYVSLWCGKKEQNIQDLKITTIVKYHNSLGKVYFFIIRPFHKILIRYILNRTVKICSKTIE